MDKKLVKCRRCFRGKVSPGDTTRTSGNLISCADTTYLLPGGPFVLGGDLVWGSVNLGYGVARVRSRSDAAGCLGKPEASVLQSAAPFSRTMTDAAKIGVVELHQSAQLVLGIAVGHRPLNLMMQ